MLIHGPERSHLSCVAWLQMRETFILHKYLRGKEGGIFLYLHSVCVLLKITLAKDKIIKATVKLYFTLPKFVNKIFMCTLKHDEIKWMWLKRWQCKFYEFPSQLVTVILLTKSVFSVRTTLYGGRQTFITSFGSNSSAFKLYWAANAGLSRTPHHVHERCTKGCSVSTVLSVPCSTRHHFYFKDYYYFMFVISTHASWIDKIYNDNVYETCKVKARIKYFYILRYAISL